MKLNQCLALHCNLVMNNFVFHPSYTVVSRSSFTEQYAVQDFLKAAKEGVNIDGEVLTYLELAQVGHFHTNIH